MLAAVLALLTAVIGATATAGVALYRVRTVDRQTAKVDEVKVLQGQVKDLWEENRHLRKDLDDAREDCEICRAAGVETRSQLLTTQFELAGAKVEIANLRRQIDER